MRNSDANGIPRWFEDAISDGSVILKPGRLQDVYEAKMALRSTKPV